MADSQMAKRAVFSVDLHSNEGKCWAQPTSGTGPAPAAAGSGETASALTQILRGSLVERYVTCGNLACKCAKGERHGPIWYLTVTLGRGRTTGGIISEEKVAEVRGWIENYHKVKDHLEKISEINRELLRRERARPRKRPRKG